MHVMRTLISRSFVRLLLFLSQFIVLQCLLDHVLWQLFSVTCSLKFNSFSDLQFVPLQCLSPAGEYNLRLGIMKELRPDMVATYEGR